MSLDWLSATSIAHRGLHDRTNGVIENTLSAAQHAMARGFTIECDVQRTADGEAMIFHDFDLDRLTSAAGPLAAMTAAALAQIEMRGTTDRIVTLREFLDVIGDAVPVIVEIKSAFDGDMRLAECTAQIIAGGPPRVAIQSFDPEVIVHLRGNAALKVRSVPLGVVAERNFDQDGSLALSPDRQRDLEEFLHFDRSRPDFVSFKATDMPCAVPFLCRSGLGIPVFGWTVRSAAQAAHARKWTDQIIFEGFDPA